MSADGRARERTLCEADKALDRRFFVLRVFKVSVDPLRDPVGTDRQLGLGISALVVRGPAPPLALDLLFAV